MLLESVRDVKKMLDRANHYGKTPLVMVAEGASTEENEKIARMLLKAGADPKAGQVNPLMAAVREKNYRVMRILYDHGVQPDASDGENLTPVHFAL